MKAADLVLDRLEASSFVKRLGDSWKAACVFARIFARNTTESHVELCHKLQTVNREILRAARVRLDVVCMLLHRQRLSKLMVGTGYRDTAILLFTDASPQWRGSELRASILDPVSVSSLLVSRRLLSVEVLDRGLSDAVGKTCALLWQLFLVAGGCWSAMHTLCSRVRAIVTDLGMEQFICNQPGLVLEEFFRLCPCPVPAS